ncbi:MAG: DNA polymerase subunit beta [Cyanobacteria bacterium CRU_2_1]|nr:DNA polymerase subunit beta [Cyanobacteria bacterium RU_5_0]NJR63459.1 DNA polymerase subunit beta [Cyanobacteria bacterium CRU_2_1]
MIDKKKIYDRLNVTPEQLAAFCKQHHILELSLFGSILRDDFRPDSDIDILVVFNSDSKFRISLMDLVGMEYQLEDMFGREVDLIEKRSVVDSHNWIRRKNILNTAQLIYESRRILPA